MGRWVQRGLGALLVAGLITACETASPVETGPEAALLFLPQFAPTNTVMEALFRGPINLDQAGCFRLGDAEGATVIWPFGSGLVREKTGLVVVDSTGEVLVRIGLNVRVGGGEVSDLRALKVLTGPLLEAALSRCPGSYWIVGDVL